MKILVAGFLHWKKERKEKEDLSLIKLNRSFIKRHTNDTSSDNE